MDERHPLRARAAWVAATACYMLAQGLKDALRFSLAERWFLRAASLAAIAEDRDLQVEALCSSAAMLAYQGQTEAAKRRIMPLQSDKPADTSYYAAIEKAVTFAALWDVEAEPTREDAYMALSAFDHAEAIAEKLDDGPASFLLSRPREGMADHWRGHVLTRLGHVKEAYAASIRELATLPHERRSARGKVHANLADVCLQGNDLETALWHLEQALRIAVDTKSSHGLIRVERLRHRMGTGYGLRAMKELDEQLRQAPEAGRIV
jgi:tetratricopeptide (TPR) repeat protein